MILLYDAGIRAMNLKRFHTFKALTFKGKVSQATTLDDPGEITDDIN